MTRSALALLALIPLAAGCAGILGIEELSGDGGASADATTDSGHTSDSSTADSSDGGGPDVREDSAPDARDTGAAPEGDGEAGGGDAGCAGGAIPCSCMGTADAGMSNCGPSPGESCCTSPLVDGGIDGGTFLRGYDGVTYTDASSPATVSPFRLDKYEVTVGRFRQFVDATVANRWTPPAGSGKHSHLNGGQGLVDDTGGFEPGWDVSDDQYVPSTLGGWNTGNSGNSHGLLCDASYQTWTPSPGNNENLPINCENWYEAYAFCIWDGGFLPSAAEWNFAAAGGGGSGGQRVYAWSVPSSSTTIDCNHANYDPSSPCVSTGANAVGSESPTGDGAFGQADLTGNLWEWNLDAWSTYRTPCHDCAYLTLGGIPLRFLRGGARDATATQIVVSATIGWAPSGASSTWGVRCARAP